MQIGDDWALVLATHNGTYPLSDEGSFGPQSMSRVWVISGHWIAGR
jgi:hypothetical protein